ncbi:MAG: hypothetical protein M1830_002113 [Pleopsidium flavum]|nr:MAG: hypothetical protein M1830_002113 [Pleopsidium flavum]
MPYHTRRSSYRRQQRPPWVGGSSVVDDEIEDDEMEPPPKRANLRNNAGASNAPIPAPILQSVQGEPSEAQKEVESDTESTIVLDVQVPATPHDPAIKEDEDEEGQGLFDPARLSDRTIDVDGFEVVPRELFFSEWFNMQDSLSQVTCTQIDRDEHLQRAKEANLPGDLDAQLEKDDLNWTAQFDLDEDEGDEEPQSQIDVVDGRTSMARTYEAAMQIGLLPLIKAAVAEEGSYSKTFKHVDTTWLQVTCILPILASMDEGILRHIINGNLARAKRRDPTIRAQLERMRVKGNTQPAIYSQLLVDSRGYSPTPEELTEVIKAMGDYCELRKDREQQHRAIRIDKAFNPNSRWGKARVENGEFKYLYSPTQGGPDHRPCQSHIDNINEFCRNLETRMQNLHNTPLWTKPLTVPLVEYGYAGYPVQRLASHRAHQNSNYIMNLVDAICRVLFHDRFHIEQYIIYHIFQPHQAVAAEVIFTRLGQGYIVDGGGFSHYLAGRSNQTALDIPATFWEKYLMDAVKNTPLLERHRDEATRMQDWVNAQEQLYEEVVAVKDEFDGTQEVLAKLEAALAKVEESVAEQEAEVELRKQLVEQIQRDENQIDIFTAASKQRKAINAMYGSD